MAKEGVVAVPREDGVVARAGLGKEVAAVGILTRQTANQFASLTTTPTRSARTVPVPFGMFVQGASENMLPTHVQAMQVWAQRLRVKGSQTSRLRRRLLDRGSLFQPPCRQLQLQLQILVARTFTDK